MELKVLDKGFVRLESFSGSDLNVVNAARVSYGAKKEVMDEGDQKLIDYLIRNNHMSPFEHNLFTFHVKAPISVFREWHRHRIGTSINEISGRYVKLDAEFYVPRVEDVRVQVGKPGHYTYEPAEKEVAFDCAAHMTEVYNTIYFHYEQLLEKGIAKELARQILPVGIYSEMYWSCNARSLMHFLNLRNSEDAMFEIREYAKMIEDIFSTLMPITHRSYINHRSHV